MNLNGNNKILRIFEQEAYKDIEIDDLYFQKCKEKEQLYLNFMKNKIEDNHNPAL